MWEKILKNQITSAKQGVLTSDSPLPKKKKPEDCYPPLYALFQEFFKLQNILDPGKTLFMNWEHGFTPEELCKLKNESDAQMRLTISAKEKYWMHLYLATPSGKGKVTVIFYLKAYLHEEHLRMGQEKNKEHYGDIIFEFHVLTYRDMTELSKTSSKVIFDGYPHMGGAEDMENFKDRLHNSFTDSVNNYVNNFENIGEAYAKTNNIWTWYAGVAGKIDSLFEEFYPEKVDDDGDDEI